MILTSPENIIPLYSARQLHSAIKSNNTNETNKILEKQPDLACFAFRGGATPLHFAATINNCSAANALICHGADINARTEGGFTPLHWAAAKDSMDVAKVLIDLGADVNCIASNGITPLHWAANNNATNMVLFLISEGAKADAPTDSGFTPLHWAVRKKADDAATALAFKIISDQMAAEETLLSTGPDKPEEPVSIPEEQIRNYQMPDPSRPASQPPSPDAELLIPLDRGETLVFVYVKSIKAWVCKYEITNGQYRRFLASHNSSFREGAGLNADDQPVVRVSWNNTVDFCNWLNKDFCGYLPANTMVRLPTSDEWTSLANCGDNRKYPWGDQWPPSYGNYSDDTAKKTFSPPWQGIEDYNDQHPATCPVSKSGVNELGIYGLAGNVWEWCDDWYDEAKTFKVRRGGSWDFDTKESIAIDYKGFDRPSASYDTIGFRVIIAPITPQT